MDNDNSHRKTGISFQVEPSSFTRAYIIVPLSKKVQRHKPLRAEERGSNGADTYSAEHISPQMRLSEAHGLAQAIDLDIIGAECMSYSAPRPATLLGKGKVEEYAAQFKAQDIELVVVDHELTPIQQRNLEREWRTKVLDRTGLILEIFGRRARTNEGRLQVELAHLSYQKSRLVRSWTHLERQRGGFGFLGGPGETQMEADRRMIQDRIGAIRRDLEKVRRTRALHRAGRKRVPYPIVALVGYTNAGKSTLFNRLTGADVMAQDMLFATLDPTMREVTLPDGMDIILSDTVGFISQLPTSLVAAFRATLEEVIEADLILHVRDMSDRAYEQQGTEVNKILSELGIATDKAENNIFEVWNKMDCLDEDKRAYFSNIAAHYERAPLLISAQTGEGCADLLGAIEARLASHYQVIQIHLRPEQGRVVNWLHENGNILTQDYDETGALNCTVSLSRERAQQLESLVDAEAISMP